MTEHENTPQDSKEDVNTTVDSMAGAADATKSLRRRVTIMGIEIMRGMIDAVAKTLTST